MNLHKYTADELRTAVAESDSIAEVLRKLGLKPNGGNYATFRKAIAFFNVDTSHFTGKLWNKGRTFGPKRPIEDYLSNKFPMQSNNLKNRLFREGLLEKECSRCKNRHWMGEDIPLELDHIDGNHDNNEFENLRVLCPNCHALTPTHRRKKRII